MAGPAQPDGTIVLVEEKLLVGIVPSSGDLHRFVDSGWYRVPRDSQMTMSNHWPPTWVGAFETVRSGSAAQQIRYFAKVKAIETRTREELFPGVPAGDRAGKLYYQLLLSDLRCLDEPLFPKRTRRNPFIHTTLQKFLRATQFNDLFNDSPYEDDLWEGFKAHGIDAERQWPISTVDGPFVLDFALFCRQRSLDVEVDGRPHHSVEGRSISDAARDRALATKGWSVVRFTTDEVRKRMSYCIARVSQAVQINGGITGLGPIVPDNGLLASQFSLFEERLSYDELMESEL